jgi:hypothetical protein
MTFAAMCSRLARRGGFTGTLEELTEAAYHRILSSPALIQSVFTWGSRLRKLERLQ